MADQQLKPCRHCGRSKPLDEYWISRTNKDGLSTQCKDCMREKHRAMYQRRTKTKKYGEEPHYSWMGGDEIYY